MGCNNLDRDVDRWKRMEYGTKEFMLDHQEVFYVWEAQEATRKKKKGKAMGRMIMGIKKELMEKETNIESVKEGIMMGKVRIGKEKWRVIRVYARARARVGKNGMEGTVQALDKWMSEKEAIMRTVIGGEGGFQYENRKGGRRCYR